MTCSHGNHNWAAYASPSGAIFHVCSTPSAWTLHPGAPTGGGRGKNHTPAGTDTKVGAGWLRLGW